MLRLSLSPRPLTALYCIKPAVRARAFHSATADFVNYGVNGELVTSKVSIRIGDPGDSYVMIPPEIGHALQAGTSLINGPTLTNGCARYALSFFHDTQHFAHGVPPIYPRLIIPQQLPRRSASNVSPATLYPDGLQHTIAISGTPDAGFAELASTISPSIKAVLEKLKDM